MSGIEDLRNLFNFLPSISIVIRLLKLIWSLDKWDINREYDNKEMDMNFLCKNFRHENDEILS
jgi:hypothetical protein